ncbi:hypothetical protein M758_4G238500 [Ceratodon purpureus]|nr:hypothetical protein M758_4G238500 [Ceratodon purpureus]
MRRGPPQGLSGRRSERGNEGATPPRDENMGSVWEVVSALASALTDARDQLVTLMHNSTMPRLTGGCSRHTTPTRLRSPYPGAGAWVPNVHRGHAHSHVAFGSSTEYRLHPAPLRVRQPGPVFPSRRPEVSTPPVKRSPRRCTHPLHKMQANPPCSPSLWASQVGASWSRPSSSPTSRCDGLSPRRDRRNRFESPGSTCNRSSASNRKNLASDQERPCVGSQYAALLREDAYQLRERRLADDNRRGRRPPWGRC